VGRGRGRFLAQFPSLASEDAQAALGAPNAPEAFAGCKLDRGEARPEIVALHRDLLGLRRDDPAFAQQRADRMYGAVLGERALALRFRPEGAGDRLLLLNLGPDLPLSPIPEPLLAPARAQAWRLLWSSEAVAYGGNGTRALTTDDSWVLPAESALVLAPEAAS
jgi:maltooligosyltrehalose trehalohydrolase